jgi:hypothetical protein
MRPVAEAAGIAVVELVAGFLEHAETFYRRPDGTPTGEAANYRDAVRPWVQL